MPVKLKCCMCKKSEDWDGMKNNLPAKIYLKTINEINFSEYFCFECWENVRDKARLTVTNLIHQLAREI